MDRRTGNPHGLTPDGEKIRELREDHAGLSRVQLAQAAGISADWMLRIELYNKRISKVTGTRIARALGVRRDEILASDDDTESEPEPKALASLDAKNGPVAANDRANERDTSRSTQ